MTQFTLENYHQELGQLSTDLVGALLFSSVDRDAFIYPEDLKQIFIKHQLPTGALPTEVSVRAAMSKAASAVVTMLNDQAQADVSYHKETGLTASSPDHIRLGIYSTKCDEDVRLAEQFVFEASKTTGDLQRCDHHVFRSYFQHFRSPLTSSELRNLVVKLVRQLDPTRILQGFFVPAYRLAETEKLSGALNDVTGIRMIVLPLPAIDSVKQHAWQAFIAETRESLAEFRREIDEDFGNGTSTRTSTLSRRLDRYQELKNRAQAYASLLNFTSEDIEAEVSNLTAQVEKMLGVR